MHTTKPYKYFNNQINMAVTIATPNLWAFTKSKEQARAEQLQAMRTLAERRQREAKDELTEYSKFWKLDKLSPEERQHRAYILFAPVMVASWAWELYEGCRLGIRNVEDYKGDDEVTKGFIEMHRLMNKAREGYDHKIRAMVGEEIRRGLNQYAIRRLNEIRSEELALWRKLLLPRFKDASPQLAGIKANATIGYILIECLNEMQKEFIEDLRKHTRVQEILGFDSRVKIPHYIEALGACFSAYIYKDIKVSAVTKRIYRELMQLFRATDFLALASDLVKEWYDNER